MPGVQEDVAGIGGRGGVYYLELEAKVLLGIFAMRVGAIHNNADGAKLGSVCGDVALDVRQLGESVLLVHNLFKYNPSFGRAPTI